MKEVLKNLGGLAVGLALSLLLAFAAGENPFHVLKVLVTSSFGSFDDLALTLFYSTSLMFTGLSVALSFRAGLFNIGAEGQLLMGSLAGTAAALASPHLGNSPALSFAFALAVSSLAGALWGLIPGWLKAARGSHEVIVTMMMNFVAAGLVSYAVVGPLKNLDSQSPETGMVPGSFQFNTWDPVHVLFPNSPLNLSLMVAILVCILSWYFLNHTKWGFAWRVVGLNPQAADYNAISRRRFTMLAMTLSGAVAGLVALNEIFGSAGKLRLGFSPDYGFIGIAVALLARNQPLAIIPSALLFGALQKGAGDLDLETEKINRDFAKIIQAVILLSVIASATFPSAWRIPWLRRRND